MRRLLPECCKKKRRKKREKRRRKIRMEKKYKEGSRQADSAVINSKKGK